MQLCQKMSDYFTKKSHHIRTKESNQRESPLLILIYIYKIMDLYKMSTERRLRDLGRHIFCLIQNPGFSLVNNPKPQPDSNLRMQQKYIKSGQSRQPIDISCDSGRKCAMRVANPLKNEKGAALVIGLMFLAIVALAGSTAVILTSTDIQIGSNYKSSTMAFYNADAGVQYAIATIANDLKNSTTISNGTSNILPTTVGSSEPFTASPTGFFVTISDISMVSDSPKVYSFSSTCHNPNDGSKAQIEIFFTMAGFHPAFGVGILSDGNITIAGSPNISGGMHANGNLSQSGAGGFIDGNVSAVGTASAGSCQSPDCTISPNSDRIDVPLITAADLNAWRTQAMSAPNVYSAVPTYNYSDSGDQSHKIVFVDGNINVSGSALKNVTILATGNISVTGHSSMNADGGIGTAMIAGGNITFNGSSHTYGAFWCNGNFVNNGASTVEGSIVAGGNITRHGTFNFIQNDKLVNDNLPPGYDCKITSWNSKN
jgi:hypothetical protein